LNEWTVVAQTFATTNGIRAAAAMSVAATVDGGVHRDSEQEERTERKNVVHRGEEKK